MRLTRMVATIGALCLVTGLIVYGGLFLWPELAGSAPSVQAPMSFGESDNYPKYLYSIGGEADGPTRPNTVTSDEAGRIYVTDAGTAKVFVYSEKGRRLSVFGGQGDGREGFVFPNGIVAEDDQVIVSDSVRNDIRVFSTKGKYLGTVIDGSRDIRPGYLLSHGGRIYVSDLLNGRVVAIDSKGRIIMTVSDLQKPFNHPQGTAIDSMGHLWVADGGNYSVRVFDQKGNEVLDIRGGGKPESPFSMVRGIAFDRQGRVYIADTLAHQIRVFDREGRQLSVLPDKDETEGQLVYPTYLYLDKRGRLFVADRGSGDIKVYSVSSDTQS